MPGQGENYKGEQVLAPMSFLYVPLGVEGLSYATAVGIFDTRHVRAGLRDRDEAWAHARGYEQPVVAVLQDEKTNVAPVEELVAILHPSSDDFMLRFQELPGEEATKSLLERVAIRDVFTYDVNRREKAAVWSSILDTTSVLYANARRMRDHLERPFAPFEAQASGERQQLLMSPRQVRETMHEFVREVERTSGHLLGRADYLRSAAGLTAEEAGIWESLDRIHTLVSEPWYGSISEQLDAIVTPRRTIM